jgi:hypothetical protein
MKEMDALNKMVDIVLAYKYARKPKQGKRKLAKKVKKRG